MNWIIVGLKQREEKEEEDRTNRKIKEKIKREKPEGMKTGCLSNYTNALNSINCVF